MNQSLLEDLVSGEGKTLESVARGSWPAVMKLLAEEELEGFLYHRCQHLGICLPADSVNSLRRKYRQTAQQNVVRIRQLAQVLEASRLLEIATLVLPGAGLLFLYPDPGCRPMDDVDLLVSPQDLPRLRQVLTEMGFRSPDRHSDILARGPLQLDLHEDVVNSSRVESRRYAGWMPGEAVWNERQVVCIDGVELNTMGLPDMLLYTCLHSLRHGYSRLTWFIDLHFLLGKPIDWSSLIARAGSFRLLRPLFYSMSYMCTSMKFRPPADLRDWMQAYRFGLGEKQVMQRALIDRHRGEWGDLLWSYNAGGIWHRSLFLLQTAFPGREVLLQVFPYLPRILSPLVYPLRVLQLLVRSAKQVAAWIRRS